MSIETLPTAKYISSNITHSNSRSKPPPPARQRTTPHYPKPPKHNHHLAIHQLTTYKSTTSLDSNSTTSTYTTYHSNSTSKQTLSSNLPTPQRLSSSIRDNLSSTNTSFSYSNNHIRNARNFNAYNSLSIQSTDPSPTPLPSPRSPTLKSNARKYLKKTQSQQTLSHIYKHKPVSRPQSRRRVGPLKINIGNGLGNIHVIENNNYTPDTPNNSNIRGYTSRRRYSNRSIRSNSTCSNSSNYSYHRDSIGSNNSNEKVKNSIMCICGRRMDYTTNPMNKYPPNAVLYCQQGNKCKKKLVIAQDWFYCCRSRTSYHGTKDGKFKVCFSCSISNVNKQERIRKNHQLLIKQLKNNHTGKVLITKDTKDYILSSTSANSKDETFRLLKEKYFDNNQKKDRKRTRIKTMTHSYKPKPKQNNYTYMQINGQKYRVIMEGCMMKKGNFWNKAFKKRYFKLLENKQLYYYRSFENGQAKDERGMADLNIVNNIIRKGKNGMEIITPQREWKFLCNSNEEREEWHCIVSKLCMNNKGKLLKAKTFNYIKT